MTTRFLRLLNAENESGKPYFISLRERAAFQAG